jgi:hypothetical protein
MGRTKKVSEPLFDRTIYVTKCVKDRVFLQSKRFGMSPGALVEEWCSQAESTMDPTSVLNSPTTIQNQLFETARQRVYDELADLSDDEEVLEAIADTCVEVPIVRHHICKHAFIPNKRRQILTPSDSASETDSETEDVRIHKERPLTADTVVFVQLWQLINLCSYLVAGCQSCKHGTLELAKVTCLGQSATCKLKCNNCFKLFSWSTSPTEYRSASLLFTRLA